MFRCGATPEREEARCCAKPQPQPQPQLQPEPEPEPRSAGGGWPERTQSIDGDKVARRAQRSKPPRSGASHRQRALSAPMQPMLAPMEAAEPESPATPRRAPLMGALQLGGETAVRELSAVLDHATAVLKQASVAGFARDSRQSVRELVKSVREMQRLVDENYADNVAMAPDVRLKALASLILDVRALALDRVAADSAPIVSAMLESLRACGNGSPSSSRAASASPAIAADRLDTAREPPARPPARPGAEPELSAAAEGAAEADSAEPAEEGLMSQVTQAALGGLAALVVLCLLNNFVFVAAEDLAGRSAVIGTLIGIGTLAAKPLYTFLDSRDPAAHAADAFAQAAAAAAEKTERAQKKRELEELCAGLEAASARLKDDKPLREQPREWHAVVSLVDDLSSHWLSQQKSTTAARLRWARIRDESVFLEAKAMMSSPRDRLRRMVTTTGGNVVRMAGAVAKMAPGGQGSSSPLPLSATMRKLTGAISSSWEKRVFEVKPSGLRWGRQLPSGAVDWRHEIHAKDLISAEKFADQMDDVQVQHGVRIKGTSRVLEFEADSSAQQEQWVSALQYLMSLALPERTGSVEETRRWLPSGVEIGGQREVHFHFRGSHAKLLVRAILRRVAAGVAANPHKPLITGFEMRVRGTAIGKQLPVAAVQSESNHFDVLSVFLLKKRADEESAQRQEASPTGAREAVRLSEQSLQEVSEQVDAHLKDIYERHTRDGLSVQSAFRKVCNKLSYKLPSGQSVDPPTVHSTMLARERAEWHNPLSVDTWGTLKCRDDEEESGPTTSLRGGADDGPSISEASDEEDLSHAMTKKLQKQPGHVGLLHKLTNHTPFKLVRNSEYGESEEYIDSGQWWDGGPPDSIDAFESGAWGCCTKSGVFTSSGTAASFVYRADSTADKTHTPFDVILSHKLSTDKTKWPKLLGSVENRRLRYGVQSGEGSVEDHHNAFAGMKVFQLPQSTEKPDINIKLTWRFERAKLPTVHWSLTQVEVGAEEKIAALTVDAMRSVSKLADTWTLEGLLPATDIQEITGIGSALKQEYWVQKISKGLFERSDLPTGPNSGWLQVQFAVADSDEQQEWLEVDVVVPGRSGQEQATAANDQLLGLCVQEYQTRFAAVSNWREVLTHILDGPADDTAMVDAAADAKLAALSGEDVQLEPTLMASRSLGAAKMAGAQNLGQGLQHTVEWGLVKFFQKQRMKWLALQTLSVDEKAQYKKAKAAVAAQWLAAETPADIAAAKRLRVRPSVSSALAEHDTFDHVAAMQERRSWQTWSPADSGDILAWVVEGLIKQVVLEKVKAAIAAALHKAVEPKLNAAVERSVIVAIIQATMMSDGKRLLLASQVASMLERSCLSSYALTTSAAAALELSPLQEAICAGGWCERICRHPTTVDVGPPQYAICAVLAVVMAIGRAEYDTKAHTPREQYQPSVARTGARVAYKVMRGLAMALALITIIKCYTSVRDFMLNLVATLALLFLYKSNIKDILLVPALLYGAHASFRHACGDDCTEAARHALSVSSLESQVNHTSDLFVEAAKVWPRYLGDSAGPEILSTGLGRFVLVALLLAVDKAYTAFLAVPDAFLHVGMVVAPSLLHMRRSSFSLGVLGGLTHAAVSVSLYVALCVAALSVDWKDVWLADRLDLLWEQLRPASPVQTW